jgi:hypothetical protein
MIVIDYLVVVVVVVVFVVVAVVDFSIPDGGTIV